MTLAETNAEQVIGAVHATITGEKTLFSGLTNVHCILYFTTGRLVVEAGPSQRGDRQVPGWLEANPESLKSLKIQQIINSDPKKFSSIPYNSVTRVAIGRKWLNPRMSIITSDKIHRFVWFWPKVGVDRVEHMARSYFPPQVLVERVRSPA